MDAGWPLATLPGMDYAIGVLPAAQIDRLQGLWQELLDHHLQGAQHLAALGPVRSAEDSWRVRRGQYRQWLAAPRATVLVARNQGRLLGYAMVHVAHAAGSWQWGDEVGVLETLVISNGARGMGIGQALLREARKRLANWGVQMMQVSVLAGNDGALRFYRREGATDFTETPIMPVAVPGPC
jgi:ribosomal protein S18 acetylase RimI-like enzyme